MRRAGRRTDEGSVVGEIEDAVEEFFDAFRRSRANLDHDPGLARLSLAEFALLRAIAAHGHEGVSSVAHSAQMAQPPASRGIDRLRTKGLVETSRDSTDRRRVAITVTASGRRLLDHHRRRLQAASARIAELLGPDDAARAPDLLRALGDAIEAAVAETR